MNNYFRMKGTVGKDSETKFTNGGKALTTFSIAVSDNYKGADGNWVDVTDWIDIQIWKEVSLSKGDRVIVSGKVKKSKVEEKYYTNFVGTEIDILKPKENDSPKEFQKTAPTKELKDDVPF